MRIFFSFLTLFLFLSISTTNAQVTVTTCTALNAAIERINKGEKIGEIRVPQGTTINVVPCSGVTPITQNISIIGVGSPVPTITGGNAQSLFISNANSFSITLKNLVLTSGKATYGGCLLLNSNSQIADISNVLFQSCSAQYGGAIYSYSGQLILNSVRFLSNTAIYNGGAIYIITQGFLSTITNCLFLQNSVTSNFNDVYGGAIHSNSPLTINNSNFTLNSASSTTNAAYGGALSASSVPISVFNSFFFKNSVSSLNSRAHGGAINSDTFQVQIFSSRFESNTVSATKDFGRGGAIYSDYANISSIFTKNSINGVMGAGGAVFSYYFAFVTSSSFSSNSIVTTGRFARGGAIFVDGYSSNVGSSITNSLFTSNSVSASGVTASNSNGVNGGAVYSRYSSTDTRNTYTDNSAIFTASDYQIDVFGGAFYCESILTTTSCTYTNNRVRSQSTNAGGSAISSSSSLYVTSSSFTSNSAISDCKLSCDSTLSGGGAIYNNYQAIIKSSTFEKNSHQTSNNAFSSGGAIFLPNTNYLSSHQILFSIFNNNSVTITSGTARGGAIALGSYAGTSQVNNSNFFGNTAKGANAKGGAIFLIGYPFTSTNCSFIENSAIASSGDANGGAIDLSGSGDSNLILFATFVKNSALSQSNGYANGGSIYHGFNSFSYYPPLLLSYSTFQFNTAKGKIGARGGSVFISDYQSLICSYSSFSNSVAMADKAFGGAVFGGNYSTLNFCAGNNLGTNNLVTVKGKSAITNKINTGSSSTVKFCPLISVQIEDGVAYTPIIKCDDCDCRKYSSPCHPLATCKRTSNPPSTYCVCPANAPGTGFSCGVGNSCTS